MLSTLASYIEKKGFSLLDWPLNDPVLQQKKVSEITLAFEEIDESKRKFNGVELFFKRMLNGKQLTCTTPGNVYRQPKWMPLEIVRMEPTFSMNVLSGKSFIIMTPLDAFFVVYAKISSNRSEKFIYAVQSLIGKQNADYFCSSNSNPRARRPPWKCVSIDETEIKAKMPLRFGATSAFGAGVKRAIENLRRIPKKEAIPEAHLDFHDFILQVMRGNLEQGEFEQRMFLTGLLDPIRKSGESDKDYTQRVQETGPTPQAVTVDDA